MTPLTLREYIGEVTNIMPVHTDHLVVDLPNSGIDRNETLYAVFDQGELDTLCIEAVAHQIKAGSSSDVLHYIDYRQTRLPALNVINRPMLKFFGGFQIDPSIERDKPFAGLDALISYFDSKEFLMFRKWHRVKDGENLWTLAHREPLEEYPLPGSSVWTGFEVIEACRRLTFRHPNQH